MSQLLFVTSSVFGTDSKSRQVAEEFVSAWQAAHPETEIATRDLAGEPLPHIDGGLLAALGKAPEARSAAEAEAVGRADGLIAEVEAADVLVLAVPMYNFSVPSTFKAWIDHIARAGRTFRYTAEGPQGLLTGKRVFVASARGGVYSAGPAQALDFHEPYIRAVLGFLGLDDVTFIHAEGLAIGPEQAEAGLRAARSRIEAVVAHRVAA